MKKLMALLLAVSTMAMSTSAFAAFTVHPVGEGTGASRNYIANNEHRDGSSSFVKEEANIGTANLPTYRNGDVITFEVKGPEVVSDATLTFICSKIDKNGSDYTNANVQMIDQVQLVASNNTASCTYKLRKNLVDGLYKLEMRIGDSDTAIFSFLIGTPSVELLYVKPESERTKTNADVYHFENGNAYCFGRATITGGASFSQTDTDFGFVFNGVHNDEYIKKTERSNTAFTKQEAQEALVVSAPSNNPVQSEIEGTAQYFFRMEITGATESDLDKLPDVTVYLNK